MKDFGLFIDGQWRAARSGRVAPTINPATEEPWAHVAAAGREDVDDAVAAGRRAFEKSGWREKPAVEKANILREIAGVIFARSDELALLEVQDGGGPIRKANMADIPATAQTFMEYAAILEAMVEEEVHEESVPVPSRNLIRKEPLGVCGCILPWNFPMAAASWKIAPAIAAGNSVVVKPSPYTPVSTLALAEICTQAGVPAGVINVVTGPEPDLGAALVAHPGIAKISFTGSTAVGKRVMEAAAGQLKKLTLELGGKSPNIILEDADLECAARGALFATFFHGGQVCESGTRVLVPAKLHDQFVDLMVAGSKGIKVGDPMDPETTMGPLISKAQLDNVRRYVGLGLEQGAKIRLGGNRPAGLDKGYYFEPTIFVGARNDMRICQEEIFGPVVSILPYKTEEEALAIANDTSYGLGAAVWSRDTARALGLARRIEAGTVWVNDYHLINPKFPFGGYKQSGFGRELGPWGLAEYQQLKHIHVGEPATVDEKFYFSLLLG